MSGVSTATVLAGASLAVGAAGTAASVLGAGKSSEAAGTSAVQQAAWQSYNNQVQARAASQQAAWQRGLAQQKLAVDTAAAADTQAQGDLAVNQAGAQNVLRTQQVNYATAAAEGTARAKLAASGTDLGGSSADVLGDIAGQGMFSKEMGDFATTVNTNTIRANTARAIYGHQLDETTDQDAIALAQAAQDNAVPGLVGVQYTPGANALSAGATVLAGASNLASKWATFQQQGAFGTPADPNLSLDLSNPAALAAAQTYGAAPVDVTAV